MNKFFKAYVFLGATIYSDVSTNISLNSQDGLVLTA